MRDADQGYWDKPTCLLPSQHTCMGTGLGRV